MFTTTAPMHPPDSPGRRAGDDMPRRSKILGLPPTVRAWLEKALIDGHHGYQALADYLAEKGFSISKSSIHRYDQKLQQLMQRIRASTEAARLIAQTSPDQADEHSAAVIRMVQSALFEAMTDLASADENDDPAERMRLLCQAARAIADASRAAIGQKRWAEEVRSRLDALERQPGRRLDPETLAAVREALYG